MLGRLKVVLRIKVIVSKLRLLLIKLITIYGQVSGIRSDSNFTDQMGDDRPGG